jgi:hypothetical protein
MTASAIDLEQLLKLRLLVAARSGPSWPPRCAPATPSTAHTGAASTQGQARRSHYRHRLATELGP